MYKVKQGDYEKSNIKQSINRGHSWENRENQITEKKITAEERGNSN